MMHRDQLARISTLLKDLRSGAAAERLPQSRMAPFVGMTLDEDDARIALRYLTRPEQAHGSEVVAQFERTFAKWNGSQHAFAFSAGRKALSACIHALELKKGDEVIIPGYSCVVVQNAFDFAGVTTVHCDIELETYGPDVDSIASKINGRTKAILLHHLYGLVARDYERILELAQRFKLRVIEDCAHATGAMFRGQRVGTRGDVGFYSTEWSKVLTTVVGGIAVTNDATIAEKLQQFWNRCSAAESIAVQRQMRTAVLAYLRAKRSRQWWRLPWARFRWGDDETVSTPTEEIEGRMPQGYFTRMPPAAARIGLNQLEKIEKYNRMRRQTAQIWDHWCDANDCRKPTIIPESTPVFLRYPVLVEPARKSNVEWAKKDLGVQLGVWFKTHLHPSSRMIPDCPNADQAVARCVNFPCLLGESVE